MGDGELTGLARIAEGNPEAFLSPKNLALCHLLPPLEQKTTANLHEVRDKA